MHSLATRRPSLLGVVLLGALLLAFPGIVLAQPNPGLVGPFAVTNAEYDLGDLAYTPPGFPAPVELRGVVHHPVNLAAGPFPFVLFLHGRHATCFLGGSAALEWPCTAGRSPILSFRGYDYAAAHLASWGYIVVSISANGINARDNGVADLGALARAQLIQRHLDQWTTYNTVGAAPFGVQFVGRVDLTRVGTMGHSRGGEGVARHYLFNLTQPTPYPVKVVVPIAPTNFSRWQVNNGVAMAQLLPYCDGDVSDLQGVHFYDDARYNLTTSGYQHYLTVMGANHNFFNSNWTPGSPFPSNDDWGLTTDPWCGTGIGNGRLTAAQQRDVALNYLTAYFRNQVGGETAMLPWIDGTGGKPPNVAALNLHTSFQAANPLRRDLNRVLAAADLAVNFLGGAVNQVGLTPHDLCGGPPPQPATCLVGQSSARQPHTTPSFLSAMTNLSQLRTGWNALGAVFSNDIPPGSNRNVSGFQYFQFRTSVNFADVRNPVATAQNFSVRFTDGVGNTQTLALAPFTAALFYPPGTLGPVPKVLQNSVRVPLSAVTVDKTQLARVELLFNQTATGAILASDLHFYQNAAAPVCAVQTAAFDAGLRAPRCSVVGSVCDSGLALLNGRANISGGPEPNQPNTISNSCLDGAAGAFHSDESHDRLRVLTTDASCLARNKTVRLESTVWAWAPSPSSDALDLFFAPNAAAPVWQYITTLVPGAGGAQTLSTLFTIPAGATNLVAFRAQFRYLGSAVTCTGGAFDDHDDLIVAVQ